MTPEIDRIPVPTNGRRPHPTFAPDAPRGTDDLTDAETDGVASLQGSGVPFTPTQLAVGFGIIASLILWLLRRRRGPGK